MTKEQDFIRQLSKNISIAMKEGNIGELGKILYENKKVFCPKGSFEDLFNLVRFDGKTLPILAAEEAYLDVVKFFLNSEANPSQTDRDYGRNIFHAAAQSGNEEFLESLIEFVEKIFERKLLENSGKPETISSAGKVEVQERLVEDLTKADNSGITPLFIAVQKGNSRCLEVLISAVRRKFESEESAKEEAAEEFEEGICQAIQIKVTEVLNQMIDKTGKTLVLAALEAKSIECLETLRGEEVDFSKADSLGRTPLSVAQAQQHESEEAKVCFDFIVETLPQSLLEEGAEPPPNSKTSKRKGDEKSNSVTKVSKTSDSSRS